MSRPPTEEEIVPDTTLTEKQRMEFQADLAWQQYWRRYWTAEATRWFAIEKKVQKEIAARKQQLAAEQDALMATAVAVLASAHLICLEDELV